MVDNLYVVYQLYLHGALVCPRLRCQTQSRTAVVMYYQFSVENRHCIST